MKSPKLKKVIMLLAAAAMCIAMVACGSAAGASNNQSAANPATPPDLTGEWKQTNSESDTSYQTATITGDTIEINWVVDAQNTKSLYWAGSFTAPTSDGDYSWVSQNDKDKTAKAIMASGDDTKEFKYSDGKISYDVSMMGVTKTVTLEKQK